jgi:hypothetical protein
MQPSRSKLPRLAAALLLGTTLLAVPAAAKKTIFTLADPRGDDRGDGNFIYPDNNDLDPGDLDLVSLAAYDEGNGTRFEATFARPIRVPHREAIDDLGTQLTDVARYGFYNFNLDLYIDTDRVPGSGGVTMLPGRLAEIDPATAWEKAIILTPRPNEAKAELQRMLLKVLNEDSKREGNDLKDEDIAALKRQIPVDIESRIYFPTQIRVLGQKISFFVPALFLGGPAKATWAYVAATSGTDLLQSYDPSRSLLSRQDGKSLMILPVSPGRWQDRFGGGHENAAIQPPLVDIIVPKGKKQEAILSDFSQSQKRPAVVPGVVPAEQ